MLNETCISVVSRSFSPCTVFSHGANQSVLARTYAMIGEILAYEDQVAKLKGSSNAGVKSNAKAEAEIEKLTKELAKTKLDLESLRKQAAGNNKAYDELAEEHAKATARPGEVKKDR